jgi:hypothetical protein
VAAPGVDLDAIARELDGVGAWTVQQACEWERDGSISHYSDQEELYISRLAESRFSAYHCNAPTSRSSADARQPAAISRVLHRVHNNTLAWMGSGTAR